MANWIWMIQNQTKQLNHWKFKRVKYLLKVFWQVGIAIKSVLKDRWLKCMKFPKISNRSIINFQILWIIMILILSENVTANCMIGLCNSLFTITFYSNNKIFKEVWEVIDLLTKHVIRTSFNNQAEVDTTFSWVWINPWISLGIEIHSFEFCKFDSKFNYFIF